ncbi:hypothetical protein E2C01_069988 [Portunus trituberculatus]|uniref:Uncharacterized protein n=1 Tax=Portunus trituberculatus TaxID=210409 RepID=A0A5B7I3Z1_PORTR|nr:hypothetical protein [Portunus trituberculatus]
MLKGVVNPLPLPTRCLLAPYLTYPLNYVDLEVSYYLTPYFSLFPNAGIKLRPPKMCLVRAYTIYGPLHTEDVITL